MKNIGAPMFAHPRKKKLDHSILMRKSVSTFRLDDDVRLPRDAVTLPR